MPKRFGKYTLIHKLAQGGMAELFLAIQKGMAGFEKLLVVKRILPKFAEDESFVKMLEAEARVAATLNHPNVAHVYEVALYEGQPYIAMEYIHGEDLRSIVRQMKKKGIVAFPLEHVLAVVLGCCAGLAYAHDKKDLSGNPLNIVHRDVSPQNILVTFTGDVKLVDFGIAMASSGAEEAEGTLKGKVPYMSPEQARGQHLDARSDIFAVGVILFELSTGRRLFKGKDQLETLKRIVQGTYPSPRAFNPALPPRLEEIIMRALAKDKDERYQTARQMQSDLEEFIREERLAVSPLSLGEWMANLFEDKLAQQKTMLQEGRQLAEVLISTEDEFSGTHGSMGTGVRARDGEEAGPKRAPWVMVLLMLLASAGIAGVLAVAMGGEEAHPTAMATLAVASTPPGAAIWIDGEQMPQRTPATLTMPVAMGHPYNVRISAEGFVPFQQAVQLHEQGARVVVQTVLERAVANALAVLSVRSTPPGAHVIVDGRDSGQVTPATIPGVSPGEEHALSLALDGFQPASQTLTLRPGEVREVVVPLERTPLGADEGLLHVEVVPPEARIQLDGTWYETGSPYDIRVPARSHRLVVARTGFRNDERTLELPGGQATNVTVTLERARVAVGSHETSNNTTATSDPTPTATGPGTLTFNSRPWCNVSIGGRALGQTPLVDHSLPAGTHRVVCENPELGLTQTVSVEIRPGEPTRRTITLQ